LEFCHGFTRKGRIIARPWVRCSRKTKRENRLFARLYCIANIAAAPAKNHLKFTVSKMKMARDVRYPAYKLQHVDKTISIDIMVHHFVSRKSFVLTQKLKNRQSHDEMKKK